MVRSTGARPPNQDVPPGALPDVPPPRQQAQTHDWTLQAVMEMQKSLGTFGQKLDRVCDDVKDLGAKLDANNDKLDKLRHWQSRILGGAAVLAAVVAIVWTVLNLVPWDRIKLEPATQTAPSATPKP